MFVRHVRPGFSVFLLVRLVHIGQRARTTWKAVEEEECTVPPQPAGHQGVAADYGLGR